MCLAMAVLGPVFASPFFGFIPVVAAFALARSNTWKIVWDVFLETLHAGAAFDRFRKGAIHSMFSVTNFGEL